MPRSLTENVAPVAISHRHKGERDRRQWGMPSPCTYGPRHIASNTQLPRRPQPPRVDRRRHIVARWGGRRRRWPHREGQRISTSHRRLFLRITRPLHTSSTGRGRASCQDEEGQTGGATNQPQAPTNHEAPKAAPSRRERYWERHCCPTKLGLSPRRPRGRGSDGGSPYRCLHEGEWRPQASPSARPAMAAMDFVRTAPTPQATPPVQVQATTRGTTRPEGPAHQSWEGNAADLVQPAAEAATSRPPPPPKSFHPSNQGPQIRRLHRRRPQIWRSLAKGAAASVPDPPRQGRAAKGPAATILGSAPG